jgi:hypothetical protein
MHIDEYRFGRMVVDGKAYEKDLVLLPEGVRPNWWREEGHSLSPADLQEVLEAKPEVLVIGTGAYGVMGVPAETCRAIEQAGIELVAERTARAVDRYNDLAASGRRVAGGFHLTC